MTFEFQMLGRPTLLGPDGSAVRLPTRKSAALLYYLADAGGDGLPRESLSALVWSRSAPDQSRASLRQELAVIRKALRPYDLDLIVTEGDSVRLDMKVVDVDSLSLRALCRTPPTGVIDDTLDTLYRGPFLDGISSLDEPFDDWVWMTRADFQQAAAQRALTALGAVVENGVPDAIERAAKLIIRIDPTEEEGHARLIEALRDQGKRGRALSQVSICRRTFQHMLDAQPSARIARLEGELLRVQNPVATGAKTVAAPPVAHDGSPVRANGQRRMLIAVSIDLSGYAEALDVYHDPEDWAVTLAAPRAALIAEISAAGGNLHRDDTNCLTASFGTSGVGEHDPERIVRYWFDALHKDEFRLARVGIARGLAVVRDTLAAGSFLSTAQRLCNFAAGGEIAVTPDIAEAIAAEFETVKDGEVCKVGAARRLLRADIRRRPGFVGRNLELDVLAGLYDAAATGCGQAVLISGEPGMGKSRLTLQILDSLGIDRHAAPVFQGSPHETATTFFALTDYLNRAVVEGAHDKELEDWLAPMGKEARAIQPYLGALLSRKPTEPELPDLSDQAMSFFAQLADALAKPDQPVMMIFDDVQWLDRTTLDALCLLIDNVASRPALILMTCRTGEVPEELDLPELRQMPLVGLTEAEAWALVSSGHGDTDLDEEDLREVLHRSEGNPLVLEEMTRALSNRNTRGKGGGLPLSLSGILSERLDRMPDEHPLLQRAAVLGGPFTPTVLAQIMQTDVASVSPMLDRLKDANLLLKRRRGAGVEYGFRHALFQDHVYSTILKEDRKALHAATASVLHNDPQMAETRAETIAHHYVEAAQYAPAVACYTHAARRAVQFSATREAVTNYGQALRMLEKVESGPDRDAQELSLRVGRLSQRNLVRGIPTEEILPDCERILALCEDIGDMGGNIAVSMQMWGIHLVKSRFPEAEDVVRRAADLSQLSNDPVGISTTAMMRGTNSFYQGQFHDALEQFELFQALYKADEADVYRSRFGFSVEMFGNGYLAWTLALSDEPDQAWAAIEQMQAAARDVDTVFSVTFAAVFAAATAFFLDEVEKGEQLAQQSLALAREHGQNHWFHMSRILLGRAADLRGDVGGLPEMRSAVADYVASGTSLARPYAQAWIADALIRRGWFAEAEAELASALCFSKTTGESYFDPEFLRLRGELAAQQKTPVDQVTQQFEVALQLAERQGAVKFVNRINVALAERV